jgi:hypothetical protein
MLLDPSLGRYPAGVRQTVLWIPVATIKPARDPHRRFFMYPFAHA